MKILAFVVACLFVGYCYLSEKIRDLEFKISLLTDEIEKLKNK